MSGNGKMAGASHISCTSLLPTVRINISRLMYHAVETNLLLHANHLENEKEEAKMWEINGH